MGVGKGRFDDDQGECVMTLTEMAEKNGALVINEMPDVSWRVVDAAAKEKAHSSLLQRLLGFCEGDEGEEEDCAACYSCWTCGASYDTSRAREFLMHIMTCCAKDPSS